jgi:ADP-heptose:LPS heptosyltransferase
MSLDFKLFIDRCLGVFLIFLFNPIARLLGCILKRDHDLAVRGDILVIKMLGGGSLVMAFPALLGIRRAYPEVKLRLFTTRAVKPFAETLGLFDDIIVLDDSSFGRMFASGFHCLKACFSSDTVIDLEIYSYLSTVLSLLTCARNRLGFFFDETGFRQILHTHRVFFHQASPLYLHYDRMAELLGASLAPPAECAAHVRAVLKIEEAVPARRIAVGCGCSGLSSERKLTPQQWTRHVFASAPDQDREVIFLGAKSDKGDAVEIARSVMEAQAWKGPLTNTCGDTDLPESLRALAACEEFWGIESSLLHYARLLGLKCKAFLGPTHPLRLRPHEGLEETIFYRKTVCSPCIHLVSTPPCHAVRSPALRQSPASNSYFFIMAASYKPRTRAGSRQRTMVDNTTATSTSASSSAAAPVPAVLLSKTTAVTPSTRPTKHFTTLTNN